MENVSTNKDESRRILKEKIKAAFDAPINEKSDSESVKKTLSNALGDAICDNTDTLALTMYAINGELWATKCWGTIENCTAEKITTPENEVYWRGEINVKLSEGEKCNVKQGDIYKAIYKSNEDTSVQDASCGFINVVGYATSYFTVTEVVDLVSGKVFKYETKKNALPPKKYMQFILYGSTIDKSRQSNSFTNSYYTRYLMDVDTYEITTDKNVSSQIGLLDGLTFTNDSGEIIKCTGEGVYQKNCFFSGTNIRFSQAQKDELLSSAKSYSAVLDSAVGTIVQNGDGEQVTPLDELKNKLTVFKGQKILTQKLTASAGFYSAYIETFGCDAILSTAGELSVTKVSGENSAFIDVFVNCEGEVKLKTRYNILINVISLDNTLSDLTNEGDATQTDDTKIETSDKFFDTYYMAFRGGIVLKILLDTVNVTASQRFKADEEKPIILTRTEIDKGVLTYKSVEKHLVVKLSKEKFYGDDVVKMQVTTQKGFNYSLGVLNVYIGGKGSADGTTKNQYTAPTKRYTLEAFTTPIYFISMGRAVIHKNSQGVVTDGNFTVSRMVGTQLTTNGVFEYSIDDSGVWVNIAGDSVIVGGGEIPFYAITKKVNFRLYNTGGNSESETIYVIADGSTGAKNYVITLNNDSDLIACDVHGTPTGAYPLAETQAEVFFGSEVAPNVTYNMIYNNCTGNSDSYLGTVKISGITSDNATVDIDATVGSHETDNEIGLLTSNGSNNPLRFITTSEMQDPPLLPTVSGAQTVVWYYIQFRRGDSVIQDMGDGIAVLTKQAARSNEQLWKVVEATNGIKIVNKNGRFLFYDTTKSRFVSSSVSSSELKFVATASPDYVPCWEIHLVTDNQRGMDMFGGYGLDKEIGLYLSNDKNNPLRLISSSEMENPPMLPTVSSGQKVTWYYIQFKRGNTVLQDMGDGTSILTKTEGRIDAQFWKIVEKNGFKQIVNKSGRSLFYDESKLRFTTSSSLSSDLNFVATENTFFQPSWEIKLKNDNLKSLSNLKSTDAAIVLRKTFSLKKIYAAADGKDAVLYKLNVTPNVISKDASGVVKTGAITVGVLKVVGNTSTVIPASEWAASTNNIHVTYTVDNITTITSCTDGIITLDTIKNTNVKITIYLKIAAELYDTETVEVVKDGATGEVGASAYTITLDNDADLIACDVRGNPTGVYPLATTKAHVYYGNTEATNFVYSADWNNQCSGDFDAATGILKVRTITADNASVDIKATINGVSGLVLKKTFSLKKIYAAADGKDAVLYKLDVVPNVISKDASGAVKTGDINIKVLKVVGDTSTLLSYPNWGSENINVTYAVDNTAAVSCANGTIDLQTVVGTKNKITVYLKILTELYDTETVEVVKDGATGESTHILTLDNDADLIACDTQGTPTGSFPLAVTQAKTYYGNALAANVVYSAIWSNCSGEISASGLLQVRAVTGDTASAEIEATIGNTKVKKTFSLKKIYATVDGKDAVLYKLNVTPNVISKDASGAVKTGGINIKVLKVIGNISTIITPSQWQINNLAITYTIDGGAPISNTNGLIELDTIVTVSTKLIINLKFNNVEYDTETVEVVRDGATGEAGKPGVDGKRYEIICPISNFVRNSLGNWVVPVATAQFTKDGILDKNGEKLYCGVTFTQNPDGTTTQQYTILVWRGGSNSDMQVAPAVGHENFAILFFVGSSTLYKFAVGEVYTLEALETKIGFKIAKTYPLGILSDGKDGVNGADGTSSFPRACGEWKANKTYVWDKDFRDACYTIVNGISTVWIRDGYGTQAPNTEPVTGSHIGWILGNKEMFTAIDTALIDGADIAGFLYRNSAMQSRIGYYFQNNGTLIENKTQQQANEDSFGEGYPNTNWSPNIYMDGKNGVIENSGSISSNTTMFSRNFMATSSVSGMLSNYGTRGYNTETKSMHLNDRTGIGISYNGKYNPFGNTPNVEYDEINFAVDLNNPTVNYHGLLELRVSGNLRPAYNQQGERNDTPYIPLVLSTEVQQLRGASETPIVQQQLALLIKRGLTAGIRKKVFSGVNSAPPTLESGSIIVANSTLNLNNNIYQNGDYFLIMCSGNTAITGSAGTVFNVTAGLHIAVYDKSIERWRVA